MDEINHIVAVLRKYLSNKKAVASTDEFLSLLKQYPFLTQLVNELDDESQLISALKEYGIAGGRARQKSQEHMWNKILNGIHQKTPKKRKKIPTIWIYVAAACLLIVLFIGFGPQWQHDDHSSTEVVDATSRDYFAPGGQKAYLQSNRGTIIHLKERRSVIIDNQQLVYDDGSIAIKNKDWKNHNWELITPKGGQYQITLDDGSKIWMNADSRLSYPAKFNADQREVLLEGEAYFEVRHEENRPFIVRTPLQNVRVLGTHFNIEAYPDEPQSAVSLIDGSLQVATHADSPIVLKPNFQSVYDGKALEVKPFEVNDVMAWKNGEFMFNNERLEDVMKKLARWYDLDIKVAPELKDVSIWGSISQYDHFDKVFDLIKLTDNQIKMKADGREVFISK